MADEPERQGHDGAVPAVHEGGGGDGPGVQCGGARRRTGAVRAAWAREREVRGRGAAGAMEEDAGDETHLHATRVLRHLPQEDP